jgi:methionyl-tRNA formyltransferase
MSRRIALFANGKAGIEISEFLAKNGDQVVLLFLSGQYPELDNRIQEVFSGLDERRIHFGDLRRELGIFEEVFSEAKVDTIITVYWPFLLPREIIEPCTLTVNFHPALLPLNRGWYPHVHNILDGSRAGVTLHKLSEFPDEGDIWVQKEVKVYPWDLASDLYSRLQKEIVDLFIANWHLIQANKIAAFSQMSELSSYHKKSELLNLDFLDLDKSYKGHDFLNLLRARTFGEKGFAYFLYDGKKIYVRVLFKRDE